VPSAWICGAFFTLSGKRIRVVLTPRTCEHNSYYKKSNAMKLFCIDPSIKALGWAVFEDDGLWVLDESGVLTFGKADGDWQERVKVSAERVYDLAVEYGISAGDRCVIEHPQVLGGARGEAASNTGATLKLMAQAWTLRTVMEECLAVETVMVHPTEWKGNAPKEVTQRRVRRHWRWTGEDHNEADAVGIGDWYLRKAKRLTGRAR